jgi:thiol-disulfide isomerase/thioredoxin
MRRLSLAVIIVSLLAASSTAADRPRFAVPLNVLAESSKIQSTYAKALSQAAGDRKVMARALADRDVALGDLATAAERANSTEYRELANVYFLLQRYDAAARVAGTAIKADHGDFASHAKRTLAFCRLQKLDDARASLSHAMSEDVPEREIQTFLLAIPSAAGSVVSLLTNNHKYTDANRALDELQAKLDKLAPQNEKTQESLERAKKSIAGSRSRIVTAQKQDGLIGKPYFPLTEATWLNTAPIKPEQLRGRVVLIDFWAVWCGPCIAMFPHLCELQEKYGKQGLVVIGATSHYGYDWDAKQKHIVRPEKPLEPAQEDAATTAFIKHYKLNYRIAVLTDRDLQQKYVVSGIPHAVLIDKQGTIRLIRVGSSQENADALEAGIRQMLGLKAETAGR